LKIFPFSGFIYQVNVRYFSMNFMFFLLSQSKYMLCIMNLFIKKHELCKDDLSMYCKRSKVH
jgi:hypothetical protein